MSKASVVIGEFLDSRGFLRCPTVTTEKIYDPSRQYDWIHGPWMVSLIEDHIVSHTDVIISVVEKVSYGKMLLHSGGKDRIGLVHLRGPTHGLWLSDPFVILLKALTDEEFMPLLVGISDAEPIIRYWSERSQDCFLNGNR